MMTTKSVRHLLPGTALALLAVLCFFPGWAQADDVMTLSGTTYREVRTVRVDPDGVTWEHATGICKVDFNDLPEPLRRQYHYDARQAAAFRDAQAQARQQSATQMEQLRRDAEAHRVQRFQAPTAPAAAGMDSKPGEFVYRRKPGEAAAEKSVGEEIAAKKAVEDFRTKDDGTMWDRRLWAVPVFLLGGNAFNGVAFDPKTDFNSHEFQAGGHHAPGGFAADSAHDSFFEPNYQTKSYYDEIDRAAAFARGRP